jgi:hypothetical protein
MIVHHNHKLINKVFIHALYFTNLSADLPPQPWKQFIVIGSQYPYGPSHIPVYILQKFGPEQSKLDLQSFGGSTAQPALTNIPKIIKEDTAATIF